MAIRIIFKILLIAILIITILNCSYANAGPQIGPNKAKTVPQDYLNSHSLLYIALTPNWDAWKFYVKDTKTGEKKWLPFDTVWSDMPDVGGPGIYKNIPSIFNNEYGMWFVQVNDKNGKNVGQIYVDDTTGKILKVTVPQKSQAKNLSKTTTKSAITPKNTTNTTNTANLTGQTFPESNSRSDSSGNNTEIISIIALIIAIGASYLIYTKI